jgi:hypothetical protein
MSPAEWTLIGVTAFTFLSGIIFTIVGFMFKRGIDSNDASISELYKFHNELNSMVLRDYTKRSEIDKIEFEFSLKIDKVLEAIQRLEDKLDRKADK